MESAHFKCKTCPINGLVFGLVRSNLFKVSYPSLYVIFTHRLDVMHIEKRVIILLKEFLRKLSQNDSILQNRHAIKQSLQTSDII